MKLGEYFKLCGLLIICTMDFNKKFHFFRFYSLMIFLMGVIIPLTLGVVSSASIAFVYKTSSFEMSKLHAFMWGVGQTVTHAFFGSVRFLASL